MIRVLMLPLIDQRRDRRVVELLGCLWLLSLADLGFTLWAHEFTPFRELNPIAAHFLRNHLLTSLVVFKLVLTAIGTHIFWHVRRSAGAELSLWGVLLVYVMLAFRWSEYTMGH